MEGDRKGGREKVTGEDGGTRTGCPKPLLFLLSGLLVKGLKCLIGLILSEVAIA